MALPFRLCCLVKRRKLFENLIWESKNWYGADNKRIVFFSFDFILFKFLSFMYWQDKRKQNQKSWTAEAKVIKLLLIHLEPAELKNHWSLEQIKMLHLYLQTMTKNIDPCHLCKLILYCFSCLLCKKVFFLFFFCRIIPLPTLLLTRSEFDGILLAWLCSCCMTLEDVMNLHLAFSWFFATGTVSSLSSPC